MNLLTLFQQVPAATMVALVVSPLISGVSSLIAKQHWPAALVGVITLALAAVNGFAAQWAQAGDGFDWKAAAGTAVVSYLLALGGRFGIFKDTKLDAKLLATGSGSNAADWTAADTPPPATPDYQPEHAA
jgi:hypothetical protein